MNMREIVKALEIERERINKAILTLTGAQSRRIGGRKVAKRKMSKAARARISKAQKARWKKTKAAAKA